MTSLNTLKPAAGSKGRVKRVGRGIGSTLGKTCGKGHKGQKARSGGSVKPGFEGGQMPMYRRVPKSGFNSRLERITEEVALYKLDNVKADVIDIQALRDADLIKHSTKRAKIINTGKLTKKIAVKGIKVTKSVEQIIKDLGGEVS